MWLSIITPVFNAAQYIEQCLQSVCSQNCEDVEHIIFDGGSTDGTVDVLRKFAAQYPHIQFVSEPDRGQSDAMNKAIALASGRWIGVLNADDYYSPGVFDELRALDQTLLEPSIAMANCQMWNSEGKAIAVNAPAVRNLRDLVRGLQFSYNPAAYFYHKSIHDQVGLYLIEDHYTMDLEFLLRAFKVANVRYVNAIWGNYRIVPGTKTYGGLRSREIYDSCDELRKAHLSKLSLKDQLYIRSVWTHEYLVRKFTNFFKRVLGLHDKVDKFNEEARIEGGKKL
jgi:glycosyltransferase involved in cell wall biosynthesis